jgi:hypothetical protein
LSGGVILIDLPPTVRTLPIPNAVSGKSACGANNTVAAIKAIITYIYPPGIGNRAQW